MKPQLYLFALAFTLSLLSSCMFTSHKPITNKEETINALNSEWKTVDDSLKL